MFTSRKELFDAAKEMYVSLMTRAAKRYTESYKYTVMDLVGFSCTLIEELLRPLWGIAPIINECDFEIEVEGKPCPVSSFIVRVMDEGTDPDSPRRFDKDVTEERAIGFANQSVTEVAAYMVAAAFAPGKLWDPIAPEVKERIAAWVRKWSFMAIRNSWQNNHYWYPIFCIEALRKLGYDCSEVDCDMKRGYDFLETLYYKNGWYSDGDLGRFDYYEAWAHHAYTLLWILIADKSAEDYARRAENYRRRSEEFLEFFAHYFDTDGGMAIYGRSNSYRFAAVCPFGLAALAGCNIDLGKTKTLILKNIGYFFDNCRMVDGCLPCGYLYESGGFVENYTCDGSSTCYTEGFLALLADESHPLWQAECAPLDIECGDYLLTSPLPDLSIAIVGEAAKGGVTLFNNSIHYFQRSPSEFNDMAALYGKFAYNSRAGFAIGSRDMIAIDNMISLSTPDGYMRSHRMRINNSRYENGVFYSEHTPFSNDPATVIKTHIIPLRLGYHVRVHKVILAQAYSVREGAFAIGLDADNFVWCAERHTFSFGEQISSIDTVSTVPVRYTFAETHPGMHSHKPFAMVPCYCTGVLPSGEYIFATTVGFSTDGVLDGAPTVTLKEGAVTVCQGDFVKVLEV